MSKRASAFQITDKDPTGPSTMNNDSPIRATAAQLANRKIKAVPRRRGSPSPGPPSNTPPVSFTATPATSFNFGASQPPDSTQTNSFTFGQSTPTASFPPTNGVAPSNNIMSPHKSFGGFGGGGMFDNANGSTSSQTTAFGNTPFQSGSGGFSFGSQPASSAPNPFGSIANTATPASNGAFSFGAAAATPAPSSSAPFSFGTSQSKPAETPSFGNAASTPSFSFGQTNATSASDSSTSIFASAASPTNTNGFSFGLSQPTQETPSTFTSKFAPSPNVSSTPFKPTIAADNASSSTKPSFSFGSATTAKTSEATTNPFSFGASPSIGSSLKSTTNEVDGAPSSAFGFNSTAPASSATSQPTQTTSTSKSFSFGSNTSAQATTTPGVLFNFGSSAATGPSVSSDQPSTNIFGAIKPPQSQPQSSTSEAIPTPAFKFTAPKSVNPTDEAFSSSSLSPTPSVVSPSQSTATSKFATQPASSPFNSTAPQATPKAKAVSVDEHLGLQEKVSRLTDVPAPSHIAPEDKAQYTRDIKMYRLNEQIQRCFTGSKMDHGSLLFKDYSPLFKQYLELASEIEADYKANAARASMVSNVSTSATTNESGKRKPQESLPQEPSKKAKSDSTPLASSKFSSSASSETAKKFDSFLSSSPTKKNTSTTPQSSPAKTDTYNSAGFTPFKPTPSASTGAGSTPFKPTITPHTSVPASSGGFKPNLESSTTSKASSGFKPTSTIGGTNFLAQFGAKSKLSAEEEKKKRKAEDFDSDEDDEAEWEANYEKEQEAKRRKFEESRTSLAPPPKFDSNPGSAAGSVATSRSVSPAGSVLDGPRPTGTHLFSHVSDAGSEAKEDASDEDDDVAARTPKANGTTAESLFNRITPREEFNSFNGQKADSPGDNTWKPTTPIKFGTTNGVFNFPAPAASAPPKTAAGNNLFSAAKPQVTFTPAPNGGSAPSSFSFGKAGAFPLSGTSSVLTTADTSRASTPLESENGSTAGDGNDADEAPTSNPSKDLVNWDAIKEGHEVLFEFEKARAYKYIQASKENKDQKHGWVVSGQGPVAVLKNDASGVVTILMKQSPSGKIVINTRLLPEPFKYVKEGKRLKLQTTRSTGQGLDSWLIQFGSEATVQELVDICERNKP